MKCLTNLLLLFNLLYFHFLIFPSFAESQLKKTEIENYLNSIKTLRAGIIQLSSDGEVQTGKLSMKKPGQIRFEYDPPLNHLIIASGFLLVIIDKQSTAEPQRYLTAQTPLGYLLDERINLEKNPNLKDIFLKDYKTHVSFFDQKNPSSGELELVFSGKPIELKEWTITNYSGEKTRILLDKLIINQPVNKNLFDIGQEITNAKEKK